MNEQLKGPKKGRGLFSILFSRITMMVVLLAVQCLMVVFLIYYLRIRFFQMYAALVVFGFLIVIYLLNNAEAPEFKISWIIPIMGLPVFGTLFYLYVRLERRTVKLGRELARTHDEVKPYMKQDPEIIEELRKSNSAEAGLAFYLHKLGYPVHRNSQVVYCPSGESSFAALREELLKAKQYIFLEFFIISEGYVWSEILEILQRKVREGVEVRLLYDGTNVISQLPWSYPKYLNSLGIKTKMFSPLKPVLSTYENSRDHRKIAVIDGRAGFTGGINLADEYINRKERFGHWKDAGIVIYGNAVQNLTMMFLEMWNANEKKPEHYANYLSSQERVWARSGYVIPFGDGPFDHEEIGKRVYLHILTHAKKYVHIMTPYLVLDNDLIGHLTFAAKCGIDVKIIMPHIPDKWYAFALAKTYYRELLEAGVQIYEYMPGFVHAKVFVSDNENAVVGTINCDYRSFYLHFECGTYFYRSAAVQSVEADFEDTLSKCQKITVMDCEKRSLWMKVCGHVLRLFAPLM